MLETQHPSQVIGSRWDVERRVEHVSGTAKKWRLPVMPKNYPALANFGMAHNDANERVMNANINASMKILLNILKNAECK